MRVLGSLTGLRFVAALLVFGRHALLLFAGTPVAGVASVVLLPASAGVSFFFVLSGFVLAWCHRSEDSPRSFYRRRFARIYPTTRSRSSQRRS